MAWNDSGGVFVAIAHKELNSPAERLQITTTSSSPSIAGLGNGNIIIAVCIQPFIHIYTIHNTTLEAVPQKVLALTDIPPVILVASSLYSLQHFSLVDSVISTYSNDGSLYFQTHLGIRVSQADVSWKKVETHQIAGLTTDNNIQYSVISFRGIPTSEIIVPQEGNITFQRPTATTGNESTLFTWLVMSGDDVVELRSRSYSNSQYSSIDCNSTQLSNVIPVTLSDTIIDSNETIIHFGFSVAWLLPTQIVFQFFSADAAPTGTFVVEVPPQLNMSVASIKLKPKSVNKITVVVFDNTFINVNEIEYKKTTERDTSITETLLTETSSQSTTVTLHSKWIGVKTAVPSVVIIDNYTPPPVSGDMFVSNVVLVVGGSLFCLIWLFKLIKYLYKKRLEEKAQNETVAAATEDVNENELRVMLPEDTELMT